MTSLVNDNSLKSENSFSSIFHEITSYLTNIGFLEKITEIARSIFLLLENAFSKTYEAISSILTHLNPILYFTTILSCIEQAKKWCCKDVEEQKIWNIKTTAEKVISVIGSAGSVGYNLAYLFNGLKPPWYVASLSPLNLVGKGCLMISSSCGIIETIQKLKEFSNPDSIEYNEGLEAEIKRLETEPLNNRGAIEESIVKMLIKLQMELDNPDENASCAGIRREEGKSVEIQPSETVESARNKKLRLLSLFNAVIQRGQQLIDNNKKDAHIPTDSLAVNEETKSPESPRAVVEEAESPESPRHLVELEDINRTIPPPSPRTSQQSMNEVSSNPSKRAENKTNELDGQIKILSRKEFVRIKALQKILSENLFDRQNENFLLKTWKDYISAKIHNLKVELNSHNNGHIQAWVSLASNIVVIASIILGFLIFIVSPACLTAFLLCTVVSTILKFISYSLEEKSRNKKIDFPAIEVIPERELLELDTKE